MSARARGANRYEPRRRFARGMAVVGIALSALLGVSVFKAPVSSGVSVDTNASAGPTPGSGWIRFGHFSASAGPVKILLDGRTVGSDIGFETVTPYYSVAAGSHQVTVEPVAAGQPAPTVTVEVAAGGSATVTALAGPTGLTISWFPDDLSAAPPGEAKVRVIDAEPTDTALATNFALADRTADQSTSPPPVTVAQATYGKASPYDEVPAGTYDVAVHTSSGTPVVSGRNWPVKAGTVSSLVVLKSATGPTLEALSDAVGTSAAPKGGMQTGFGGAAALLASRSADHDRLILIEAIATVIAIFGVGAVGSGGRRRLRLGTAALAVGALLAGGGLLSIGQGAPAKVTPTGAPSRPTIGRPAPQPGAVSLAASATPSVGPSVPTAISIPSIGVQTTVVSLGQNADGTAQVPNSTSVAGWYSPGPIPGQTGPAVILGHVDSYKGPGVFFDVRNLKRGAQIIVSEGSAKVAFAVESIQTYSKDDFPTESVFGPVPDRALRLITCGGAFDYSTGHYVDNVVVYATESASG